MSYLSQTFQIRTSEVDQYKRLSVPGLMRLCMETAMQHADQLNVSVWDLEKENKAWVLSRQYLEQEAQANLGETITIQTQPAGFDRLFTYRDFEVYNQYGDLMAYSSTSWIMFDLIGRRRIALPESVKELLEKTSKKNTHDRPLKRLIQPEHLAVKKVFEVGYYHLDFNGHMSNLFYPEWILESMGARWLSNHQLKRIDIIYQSENNIGERIASWSSTDQDLRSFHQLKKENGELVLSAQIQWDKY